MQTYKIKGEDHYQCREVKAERDALKDKLDGARDVLREAAKQFRCTGDLGHANMCDAHADHLMAP